MPGNDKTILMMCPKLTCRKILHVPETARGKTIRCRNCGTTCRVPEGGSGSKAAKAS
jgi:hypothetical protein